MIRLLYQADKYSNNLIGIKKIVYDPCKYLNEDYILFTNNLFDIRDDINIIITYSLELYEKYKSCKNILLFYNLIDAIEEDAIVRIENSTLYFQYLPSSNNSQGLFFTKKCNHYCLMCSEPPSKDNFDYLINENMKIVELMSKDTEVIGITGGEPTLLGKDFFKIIKKIREELPNTQIRLLTNGRSYKNIEFCSELADIAKGFITSEIPVYSTDYAKHDYIVQSRGAFFETIEGLYNCAINGLNVEIRVVLTKQNYKDLSNIVSYVYKNMPFVNHIALMGLEYIGFAINNFDEIHINPLEYSNQLVEAVSLSQQYNIPVSIYNLPICLIDDSLIKYSRKSISDWKNDFSDFCKDCCYRDICCGMFSSTKPYFEKLLKPKYIG